MRCGLFAARPDWIEALVDLQVATNIGGPSLVVTSLIAGALTDGSYLKHLEALRRRLAKARREVGSRLAALGITLWLEPRGGFFLWRRLPGGRDAAAVAQAALAKKVVLVPGNVFSVSQTGPDFIRFNVAQMTDAGDDVIARALTIA